MRFPHSDDNAVDRFAAAMRRKLAEKRAEGRGGWDDPDECTVKYLAELLINHLTKGDPVDIANFCMMLHQRKAPRGTIWKALRSRSLAALSVSNPFDAMHQAIAEAKNTLRAVDCVADDMARLLVGRLRHVESRYTLQQLKRELADLDGRTGDWKRPK